MARRAVGLAAILLSAYLSGPLLAQSEKPLAGAAVSREGAALKVSNRSDDPWVEMRIAVTERDTFDEASAYVCWGDRLDAKESLTTKLESCVNASGKRFDPARLTPRFVSVAAHVPEHGRERTVFALRRGGELQPKFRGFDEVQRALVEVQEDLDEVQRTSLKSSDI